MIKNHHLSSSSSSPVAQRPNPAAVSRLRSPARSPRPDGRLRLELRRARRLALRSFAAFFRNYALVAVAAGALASAHAASLRSAFACSEGVDLKAFGQTFPEVRTRESEVAVGVDLWRTDADQVTFTVSARRTELLRTLTRWPGSVAPQAGLDAQGFWSAPLPDKLQDVGFDLGWRHPCSPDWTLMIQARPGWRTAGTTTLTSDGFGVTGSALAMWRKSKSLQFAFGVAGDTLASGSQRLIPVAGVDWGFAPNWRLSLGLPRTGLFWQITEVLELGLAADGGWSTYYVRQRNAATYPYGRPLTDTKLEHTEARVGFQANWNVTQAIQLNLSAGSVGFRRFEYPDRDLVLKSRGAHGGYGSIGVTANF